MDTIAPVALRIKNFIEFLGVSDSQFADATGISRPTLSLLLSGKNKKVSDVMISQIHSTYPQLSIEWLLFGEGTMLATKNEPEVDKSEKKEEQDTIFLSENLISPGDYKDCLKYNTESGVNDLQKAIENSVRQELSAFFKDNDFFEKYYINSEKQRKVVQVTVYYDDSTFEIFKPLT